MKGKKLFESEKMIIANRIEQIRKNKENAGMDRQIIIAGGDPVLSSDAEEMVALKRMLEILDNRLSQKYQNEYITIRKKTKLPQLIDEYERQFSVDSYKEREKEQIKARMRKLQDQAKYATSAEMKSASDGTNLHEKDVPEYEQLLKLEKIANNDFKTDKFYEYMNIRRTTKLPKLEHFDYEIIMGTDFGMAQIDNPKPEEKPTGPEATQEDTPQPPKEADETGEKPSEPEDEEELDEVVKVTPWQWIKDHKKQILIALGITALTITTVVVLTQLLPAILAASQASQVAGLAAEMVTNGQMWGSAIASEQLALHGANTALADVITSISGVANSFDVGTGVWTLGSQALPEFAASSAVAAEAAVAKVAALTNIATVGGVGGLGALGTGLLLPKKKSQAYYEIKELIDMLKENSDILSEKVKAENIEKITQRIVRSTELTTSERNILLKKLQKAIKKAKLKGIEPESESLAEDNPELRESNDLDNQENQDLEAPEAGRTM